MNNQPNTASLPTEIKAQLKIIDQSLDFIFIIIIGVVLSYYATNVQKKQLICSILPDYNCCCLPDVFPIRLVSSLLIISALNFFWELAVNTNMSSGSGCAVNRSNIINCITSFLVLISAIFRLVDLIEAEAEKKPPLQNTPEQ